LLRQGLIIGPAATVAPSEVLTVAIVPDTANDATTSLAAAIEPLAVILLVTAPCFTVEVTRVAAAAVVAENGFATRI